MSLSLQFLPSSWTSRVRVKKKKKMSIWRGQVAGDVWLVCYGWRNWWRDCWRDWWRDWCEAPVSLVPEIGEHMFGWGVCYSLQNRELDLGTMTSPERRSAEQSCWELLSDKQPAKQSCLRCGPEHTPGERRWSKLPTQRQNKWILLDVVNVYKIINMHCPHFICKQKDEPEKSEESHHRRYRITSH